MTDTRRSSPPPVSTPPPRMRIGDVTREVAGTLRFVEHALGAAANAFVTGVHHDSRAVERGDVFVAREGGKVSGLDFVARAVERGAVVVIARRGAIATFPGIPVIEVDDVPLALARASAAVYGHPTFGLEVIGITGTNGKTTSALLTHAMIEAAGGYCGTIGTLGARLGADERPSAHTSPEADELARLMREMRDKGATHVAMEVSSIALSARRADAVRYRVAAFTNLTQDHLDYHGTMEAYGAAKVRLFDELFPAASVINVRDPFGRELCAHVHKGTTLIRYSSASDVGAPDVYPVSLETSQRGIDLVAKTPKGEVLVASPLIGAHNVENLLGAIAIGVALDLPLSAIALGLSRDVRVPGRLERCDDPTTDDVIVLVDYAHTPDALARVLTSVRPFSPELVCVFGCGGDRDPLKRPLMGEAAARGADRVIVTNDNPRSEVPAVIAEQIAAGLSSARRPVTVELDRRRAIEAAIADAPSGALILIAGKGHETYQIIGTETLAFDDREVAREALARRRARGAQP